MFAALLYFKKWHVALRARPVLSRMEDRHEKQLMLDFHAIQYGLAQSPAATQWKSGTMLSNTDEVALHKK